MSRNIREFEDWLENEFECMSEMQAMPVDYVDEWLYEDVSDRIAEAVVRATYFGCTLVPMPRSMITPKNGMAIIGKLLAWVREEMSRQSPFLDIRQAVRFVGARSERQIYAAVERGKLQPSRLGKELRFTTDALERWVKNDRRSKSR